MVALALLSLRTVTDQLRRASLGRLEHDGKTFGAAISERLRFLDGDLREVTPRRAPCGAATTIDSPPCDGSLQYGLTSLAFIPDRLKPVQFFGRMKRYPKIDDGTRAELDAGRSAVLVVTFAEQPHIYLVRRAEDLSGARGTLLGEVDPVFLWGGAEQNTLIPTMELHVFGDSGRLAYGSNTDRAELPPALATPPVEAWGTFEWKIAGARYLAAYSTIEAPAGIRAPRWTLVLSEDRAAVMAPMAEFRRTFVFAALLSLGLALVLGMSQLRRNLVPLVALQEGTRRLANQQFDEPVKVSSADEFSDLADSFNTMADRIARQFKALTTAAETDRAVLSSVDTIRIVEAVVDRMRDVCRCDRVGMMLLENQVGTRIAATMYTSGVDRPLACPISLLDADVQRLRSEPDGFVLGSDSIPAYLEALAEGAGLVRVFPLAYQGELQGALLLAASQTVGRGEDEIVQAKRVAAQVALALANARMVEQIRSLAFFDSLTGLPNRVSFKRRVNEELEQSRQQERSFAVCFLDLDHFSRINDTLGHKFGDRLVQEVAIRLKSCCSGTVPAAEVARLGGDEFTVLLPGLADISTATDLAHKILNSFGTPFALEGHEVFVSASIGIAVYPGDGLDLEDLLKNADVAMYQAKRNGRGTFELFARSMGATARQRLSLEGQLRKAIDAGQFALHYQPLVNAETRQVTGVEALLRWRHPERGIVYPGEFIALCEETGLIVPIGEWVLRTACAQARAWQLQGLPSVPVAINLSGQQLRRGNIVELVTAALAETELDPRLLELELTESILMNDLGGAESVLPALATLGVGLAIDDFGTGYSSLSYLKHLPVDTLKIDQSFIRDVTTNANDAAITSAIVAMGHALGLRIVAEGVETAEQDRLLRRQGCDLIQGHWVARPMDPDAFSAFVRRSVHPTDGRPELGRSRQEEDRARVRQIST
jgi:diguanylate cyclase (GGDEF)-like protein